MYFEKKITSENPEETMKKLQKLVEEKRGIDIIYKDGKEIMIGYTNSEDVDGIIKRSEEWPEVIDINLDPKEAFRKPSDEGNKHGLQRL